ncbi:hypothetical protein LDO31_15130 [Luteimonas sp. XNQY3]|nr:hypothetical protein [Luteimonas sp. XNQY3]MCD9007547.1 hypothetical protein [Luteimonas sp. XNQY3]
MSGIDGAAVLADMTGLAGCSGDAQQAERNIGQLQLGDSGGRARERLGEPAYTVVSRSLFPARGRTALQADAAAGGYAGRYSTQD